MEHMTPKELADEMARLAKLTPEQRKQEMHHMEQKMSLMREMRMADEESEAKAMYPNSGY